LSEKRRQYISYSNLIQSMSLCRRNGGRGRRKRGREGTEGDFPVIHLWLILELREGEEFLGDERKGKYRGEKGRGGGRESAFQLRFERGRKRKTSRRKKKRRKGAMLSGDGWL